MIYFSCIVGGMIVGFLGALRLAAVMQDDFVNLFNRTPKGK